MAAATESSRLPYLDALRAFAMLLGIALHAALAYGGTPWMVMDAATSPAIRWFFEAVHGFRMQLFFFVSGLFTMMLWRKRGWSALLEQRFQRIVVPMLLAYVTILPLLGWISTRATDETIKSVLTNNLSSTPLIQAVRKQQRDEIGRLLATAVDPNQADAEFGITPLGWASLVGDAEIARLLIEGGANVQVKDRTGFTPLHQACFLGRVEVARTLLDAGADLDARSNDNKSISDSMDVSWMVTRALSTFLRITPGTQQAVQRGREACGELLAEYRERRGANTWSALLDSLNRVRNRYGEWLRSPGWNVRFSLTAPTTHLFLSPQFGHLWFLWFLCWLVLLFLLLAPVYSLLPSAIAREVMLPVWCLIWLVPLTLAPQVFQGVVGSGLGPDTSTGVLPWPHVFVYYAVFFFAGALYFDAHDGEGRLGRWWWLWLPLAGVLFPLARHHLGDPITSGVLQVLYAWAAIFGLLGLFRAMMPRESFLVRFVSDSAYWLYLAHLPLVVYLQHQIRHWEYPAGAKFAAITAVSTLALLLVYAMLVRPTYLGTILNGPRRKQPPTTPEGTEPSRIDAPMPSVESTTPASPISTR